MAGMVPEPGAGRTAILGGVSRERTHAIRPSRRANWPGLLHCGRSGAVAVASFAGHVDCTP
jgi:hypothetical protein